MKTISSITLNCGEEKIRLKNPDVRGHGDQLVICLSRRPAVRVAKKLNLDKESFEVRFGNVTLLRLKSWNE